MISKAKVQLLIILDILSIFSFNNYGFDNLAPTRKFTLPGHGNLQNNLSIASLYIHLTLPRIECYQYFKKLCHVHTWAIINKVLIYWSAVSLPWHVRTVFFTGSNNLHVNYLSIFTTKIKQKNVRAKAAKSVLE